MYSTFLMYRLATQYNLIDENEDSETVWNEAFRLVLEFNDSEFNTGLKSEIELMIDFLDNKI